MHPISQAGVLSTAGSLVFSGGSDGLCWEARPGRGATAGKEVWEAITLRGLREELCLCRIEDPVITQ